MLDLRRLGVTELKGDLSDYFNNSGNRQEFKNDLSALASKKGNK